MFLRHFAFEHGGFDDGGWAVACCCAAGIDVAEGEGGAAEGERTGGAGRGGGIQVEGGGGAAFGFAGGELKISDGRVRCLCGGLCVLGCGLGDCLEGWDRGARGASGFPEAGVSGTS